MNAKRKKAKRRSPKSKAARARKPGSVARAARKKSPNYRLKDLLKQVTKRNRHPEIDGACRWVARSGSTMGLYDAIRCDYPLPDPELQDLDFQTKDLGQTLSRYHITADGRLCRSREAVDIFDEGHRVPRTEEPGSMEDKRYHGDINFYIYVGNKRVEYRARFTHGVIEWIQRE